MESQSDVTFSEDSSVICNDSDIPEEPLTKKRKQRTDHDDFEKYFARINEDNKIKFVCKSLKEDGTVCGKKYVGPSNSGAM